MFFETHEWPEAADIGPNVPLNASKERYLSMDTGGKAVDKRDLKSLVGELHRTIGAILEWMDAEHKAEAGTEVLTLEEAAKKVRMSPATLRAGFKSQRYPFLFRDGRKIMCSAKELDAWISRRVKAYGHRTNLEA